MSMCVLHVKLLKKNKYKYEKPYITYRYPNTNENIQCTTCFKARIPE